MRPIPIVDTIYLLRKFIVRHRTSSIIVGLLLLIIVSTSFISLYSLKEARDALQELQSKQDAYKEVAERNMAYANQVVLALFLEMWHDGKTARAQRAAIVFAEQSPERTVPQFLLDPRTLDEKKGDFQAKVSAEQPFLWEFLLGEYYLKNNNKPAAIEAYRRCLETGQDYSELDRWFINRAKRQLDELLNVNVPLKCDPHIGGRR
jgi:hypothetical protein